MTGNPRAACAVAKADFLDTVRRPGFLVAACTLGVVVALLPRLGNPAAGIRDNAALAIELTLSTIALAGPLTGGFLGIRAVQRDHGAGLSDHLLTAPRPLASFVGAGCIAAAAAATLLCALATAIGALGWIGRPLPALPGTLSAWAAVIAAAPLGALVGAALGTFYASLCSRDLAAVALVLHVAGMRLLEGAVQFRGSAGHWLTRLVPDPSRLDVAREFAFAGPIDGMSAALAAATAALQVCALLVAVPVILRRAQLQHNA